MTDNELAAKRWKMIFSNGRFGQQSLVARQQVVKAFPRTQQVYNIIDIGCGRGACVFLLGNRFPNGAVLGIDADKVANQEASHHAIYAGETERIRFQKANFDSFTFGNRKWDVIVSLDAIHYSTNLEKLMSNIGNSWSRRGNVFITVWCFEVTNRCKRLAKRWGNSCSWPVKIVKGFATQAFGREHVSCHVSRSFPKAVMRSLQSLKAYKLQYEEHFGADAFRSRLNLEEQTVCAVCYGDLKQIIIKCNANEGLTHAVDRHLHNFALRK